MISETDLRDYIGMGWEQPFPHDPVTRPKHYMLLPGVEVRDVIKALVDKMTNYHPMIAADYVQMMQYGMRFMEKNGVEDLKKMRWYLDKIIEQTEQNAN
jgi:hypothetical protein